MEINTEFYDPTNVSLSNETVGTELVDEPPWCENIADSDLIVSLPSDYYELAMEEYYQEIAHFKLVPAWLVILFLIIGFSGNIINVLVYTRPFMRSQISLLLVSLEVVNIFLFATYIPDLIRHFHGDFGSTYGGIIVETFYPAVETGIAGFSNWLTVLIGIWRFVAIKYPLNVDKWCSRFRTKLAILLVAVFNILVSSPQAFMFSFRRDLIINLTYKLNTSEEYSEIRPIYSGGKSRFLCDYPNLEQVAQGFILLTTSIPCFFLAIVTVLLLVSLWKAKRNRTNMTNSRITLNSVSTVSRSNEPDTVKETKLTVLLILLVFLYFLAYLPDSVLNVRVLTITSSEELRQEGFYKVIATRITMLVCNASTFFIYYAMSERFREALYRMLLPTRFRKDQVKKSTLTMNSFTNSSKSNSNSVKDLSIVVTT